MNIAFDPTADLDAKYDRLILIMHKRDQLTATVDLAPDDAELLEFDRTIRRLEQEIDDIEENVEA